MNKPTPITCTYANQTDAVVDLVFLTADGTTYDSALYDHKKSVFVVIFCEDHQGKRHVASLLFDKECFPSARETAASWLTHRLIEELSVKVLPEFA